MGDVTLKCPLCCTKTFNSRESLVEHLSGTIGNLFCPLCNSKCSSVLQLIEHLSHESCLQAQAVQMQTNQLRTIILEKTSHQEHSALELNDPSILEFKHVSEVSTAGTSTPRHIEPADVHNMYAELMKPAHEQDLQFIKDGESQFVILTQDSSDTVVTKQNNDGTISLTSVKEMKTESNSQMSTPEPEPDEGQEGLYSCNTCGVSFSSVIEHIQNYHNDQDVVVEEPIDEENEIIPVEYKPVVSQASNTEKQISRRVITETGDIVETPLVKASTEKPEDFSIASDTEPQDKVAGPASKRYMRMNNMCDSVIRNLKQNEKSGPGHKVMIKEVLTRNGDMIKYYHCVFCNIDVSSLSDFKSQPCKTSKYSCLQCPVSYDNAKSLCAHMKIHKVKSPSDGTEKSPDTFECEICCTVFPTNKSLKLHKRMHDPVKSRQIEAPRNSDFSEMRYLCTTCEKMIPVDYKKIHENSHLTEQNLLNCGVCNKKFTSEEYLDMHMNVHNLDKVPISKQDASLPYNCVYCDRRFGRPHEKVKHERIHTGEKPHSCDICGKSFRVSYCLTLHMRTHTGARPYGCPHCGKRFKAHSVYNHHLLTHSEVRAYKCPYCPKAFKTSVQLAGHKNSHTKPFSCTHCNRPFASLYAVRVHTETHARQNNLKFTCSLCGARYARAFALKDHMKQQHKEEDPLKTEGVTVEEWGNGEMEGTTDVEIKSSIQALNKDISVEMDQLEIPTVEMIVPN